VELHRAVEDAVMEANRGQRGEAGLVRFTIDKIGDRPAGRLPAGSELMALVEAVDRHLAIRTEMRLASTDANIPLSLGVPAVSIGGGGEGGGIHTYGEWYDAKGRDLGLRRILLLLLAVAG
jgi:di/tripeptidase